METKNTEKRIYLDNAATTPVDPRVYAAMVPYFSEIYGNTGSMHKEGVAAKMAVLTARAAIGKVINARTDELIFTGSGTEANNLAILGFARHPEFRGYALGGLHFITSVIEHHSVLECFKDLEARGARVSFIPVTREGIIDLAAFERALSSDTVFVSIMFANNEIGTIQPIGEIADLIRYRSKQGKFSLCIPGRKEAGPVFHVDASQAPLFMWLDAQKLGADMLTLDAQKVYGPKGIGLLWKKRDVKIAPLIMGGGQEFGMRAGTENVPSIVGFAKAIEIAHDEREELSERLTELRDDCIARILRVAPGAELNGSETSRLPNNINISFPGMLSEWLVLQLDARGIAVGSRSACMSQEEPGSYVVSALGKGKEYATSSIRITLGRWTTKEDIDTLVSALEEIAAKKS